MASRTKQKEEARARRMAEERAHAERAQRARRLRMLSGVVIAAIVVVVAVVVISVSGTSTGGKAVKPTSNVAKSNIAAVTSLLSGIPQSGETLGSSTAPVTITEFADLECPACDQFTLPTNKLTSEGNPGSGYLDQLINQYVRTGKVKIIYRSFETATGYSNSSMWPQQQASAYAAGVQNKAWYYIELFYLEQRSEDTSYVTPAFLEGIADQVPGLSIPEWSADSQSQSLQAQVASDNNAAQAAGFQYTPTLVVKGPKGQAQAFQGVPQSYSELTSAIKSVS